jgi:hypothetical protein
MGRMGWHRYSEQSDFKSQDEDDGASLTFDKQKYEFVVEQKAMQFSKAIFTARRCYSTASLKRFWKKVTLVQEKGSRKSNHNQQT